MILRNEKNYLGKCNEMSNAEKDLVYFQRYRHLKLILPFLWVVSVTLKLFVISFLISSTSILCFETQNVPVIHTSYLYLSGHRTEPT